MITERHKIYSTNLEEHIEISLHGHFGFNIILFPTFTDYVNENLENGLIDSVSHFIQKGKFRIISVTGGLNKSFLNNDIAPIDRSKQLFKYNNFITEELIQIIFKISGGPAPVILAGAHNGAFLAANTYLRRPDIFYGAIALSGIFNISHYSQEYFDDNCYFNSPIHFLPNLTDDYWLSYLRGRKHFYLLSGSGEGEIPENTTNLGKILEKKNIPHSVDIWSNEFGHNLETWKKMFNKILEEKL